MDQIDSNGAKHLIDGLGRWSLSELGYSNIVLGVPNSIQGDIVVGPSNGVILDVGGDATQGPSVWWRITLHLSIALPPLAKGGVFEVSASTGTYAFAQLEFTLNPDGTAEQQTIDLLNGTVTSQYKGRSIDTYYTNYLQTHGITDGPNVLTAKYIGYGTGAGASVTVLPDSFIERTLDDPYSLKVTADSIRTLFQSGAAIDIPAHLVGAATASVDFVGLPPGLQADRKPQVLPGVLHLRAVVPGIYTVRIRVSTPGRLSRMTTLGMITVSSPSAGGTSRRGAYLVLAVVWLMLVLAVTLRWSVLRKRRSVVANQRTRWRQQS